MLSNSLLESRYTAKDNPPGANRQSFWNEGQCLLMRVHLKLDAEEQATMFFFSGAVLVAEEGGLKRETSRGNNPDRGRAP